MEEGETETERVAVTFDLFGTLASVDRPADPAAAVAAELRSRGVAVPEDWAAAYRERHVETPEGAEVPLPAHVGAALRSRGVDLTGDGQGNVVRRAVVAAFDPVVETRDGAVRAVEAAAESGPVGVLSNCSVPGLAGRTLLRSAVDRDALDAVVTSAGCGWRKPAPQAFETAAARLGVDSAELVHVGDDHRTDGGVRAVGGTAVLLDDGDGDDGDATPSTVRVDSLAAVSAWLRRRRDAGAAPPDDARRGDRL